MGLIKQRQNASIFFAFLFAFVFIRLPFITSPLCLNPDEAELIATGKRAVVDFVPYRSFSTSTSGVWWPMTLGLLGRIGFPLNLKGAHLLSAIFGAVICFCIFLILKRIVSNHNVFVISLLVAIPWAACFSLFSQHYVNDFAGLATELLPLTFLAISAALFKTSDSRFWKLYLALGFTGLAIFSKYQFLIVGIFCIGIIGWKLSQLGHSYLKILPLALLCILGPTALLFGIAVLLNNDSYVYKEPIYLFLDYLRVRSSTGPQISITSRFNSFLGNLWALPSILLAAVLALSNQDLPRTGNFNSNFVSNSAKFIKLSSGFSLSVLSIMIPGIGAAHYLHLLICGLIITLVQVDELSAEESLMKNRINYFAVFVVLVLSITSLLNQVENRSLLAERLSHVRTIDSAKVSLEGDSRQNIPVLCPPKSEVLVWGWSADFYSYFDWNPATRYTIQSGMISGSSEPWNSLYLKMRRQLTTDLIANPPQCILNAIGPGYFPYVYSNAQKLQNQIKQLDSFLKSNYTKHLISTASVSTYIYAQEEIEVFVLKHQQELFDNQ